MGQGGGGEGVLRNLQQNQPKQNKTNKQKPIQPFG